MLNIGESKAQGISESFIAATWLISAGWLTQFVYPSRSRLTLIGTTCQTQGEDLGSWFLRGHSQANNGFGSDARRLIILIFNCGAMRNSIRV